MTERSKTGGWFDRLAVASFTNLGFQLHARSFAGEDTDMTGRTVVLTGATGGLGLAAATRLGSLGARTVIVGRSEAKLEAAAVAIGGDVVAMRADLSLLSDVRKLGSKLLEQEPHIDVLVNNVGVLLPERQVTSEGIEMSLATNLAGHFLLTNLLVPRLVESGQARIINVTSGGMYSERIRPDDLQFERRSYSGTTAYAHNKRGQVILTEMWAAALAATNTTVHVMHPGWARTNGVQQSLPTFDKLMRPLLRTPDQGADTIVWLAAASEPVESSGRFWFDRKVVPTHLTESTVESSDDRHRLWEQLATLTNSDLPADITS